MKNTQRIFIAAPISEAVIQFLCDQIAPYKDTPWGKQIRWDSLANLHLTLRFLGDTEKPILDKIIERLPSALQNVNTLEIGLSAPRPFPSVSRPRVIAALTHPSMALDDLANRIDDCIAGITTIKRDKHFRGHVTIGRYRQPTQIPVEILKNEVATSVQFSEVIVYKSELKPTGAQHMPLLTVALLP